MICTESLDLKSFHTANVWGYLFTALFGVFRPLIDAFIQPELGNAIAELIAFIFRRKHINSISQNIDLQ